MGITAFEPKRRISLAVDLGGSDQIIADDEWHEIEATNVIWDLNGDYDAVNNNFDVSLDGIYTFDMQIGIKTIVNVKWLEVAIFKRGDPDDYWFILDKHDVDGETQNQLNCATSFDFYSGEQYTIKIKATKVTELLPCSYTVNGDDDLTAWGYTLDHVI